MSARAPLEPAPFAAELLAWYARHGRRDLPWKRDPSAYRVWVSEIMLQQTQVTTVVPYFERFMQRFPDIAALARAPSDAVLHLWAGLGYYARARNLHRAAQQIVAHHGGRLPDTLEGLMSLPGIGRSTAGAILALSAGARHPILDGNVKRVLARYFAVEGFPGLPAVSAELWRYAGACTPQESVAEYTQAMMDLGALVCLRRRPLCAACPIARGCRARRAGRQERLPAPRPARLRPRRRTCMLIAVHDAGLILLQRRPPTGVWGGLWALPEFPSAEQALEWCRVRFGDPAAPPRAEPALQHAFTHFDLQIEPLRVHCRADLGVMEEGGWLWYDPAAPAPLGLPAPVKKLLEELPAASAREWLEETPAAPAPARSTGS